jgi:hypothetical protein
MVEKVKERYKEFELHMYSKGTSPVDLLNTIILIVLTALVIYKIFN